MDANICLQKAVAAKAQRKLKENSPPHRRRTVLTACLVMLNRFTADGEIVGVAKAQHLQAEVAMEPPPAPAPPAPPPPPPQQNGQMQAHPPERVAASRPRQSAHELVQAVHSGPPPLHWKESSNGLVAARHRAGSTSLE